MSYSWMRTATHSLLYSTKLECVGDDSKQDPRGTIIEHSRATSKSFPIFGHTSDRTLLYFLKSVGNVSPKVFGEIKRVYSGSLSG